MERIEQDRRDGRDAVSAMKPSKVFGLSCVMAGLFAFFALARGDLFSFLSLLYCAWIIFLSSRSFADHERYIIELREVMRCQERLLEARERILLARIAELEADAERYRWLAAKAQKDTAYDRYGDGAAWSIGFFADDSRHTLGAAIDAARKGVES